MSKIIDNLRFHFLFIDTYVFGSSWCFSENAVPYNMLRYITSGNGVFYINAEQIRVSPGMIIYIPRGCSLSCMSCSEAFSFISVRFTTSVTFDGDDILADYYAMPRSIRAEGEEIYFEQMLQWVKSEDIAKMYFVRGYLDLLIGSIIARANAGKKHSAMKDPGQDDLQRTEQIRKLTLEPRIQVVLDYVMLHPTEQYTPGSMAEMVGLSKQRFSSLFKEQTGKSPMVYIREHRLTAAARKLLAGNDNVGDIAYSVGYNDTNYFIREFKRAFGYTPTQYRKISGA